MARARRRPRGAPAERCPADTDRGRRQPRDGGGALPLPPAEVLLELHRRMVIGRRFDAQATALTKQGRLAVYPSSRGQEACQVGAVARAARTRTGCSPPTATRWPIVTRGVPAVEALTLLRGDWHCGYDPLRAPGRAAVHPAGHPTPCTPSASRTRPGSRARTPSRSSCVGDGATSEGDIHEALNFAGGLAGARGLPRAEQRVRDLRAAGQADRRAPARPQGRRLRHAGVLVDGNDAAAVLRGGAEARRGAAAAAAGPTLVEAHHLPDGGAHQRRRRHPLPGRATRCEAWLARDPIARLETYLRGRGLLDDDGVARRRAPRPRTFAAAAARPARRRSGARPAGPLRARLRRSRPPQLAEQAAPLLAPSSPTSRRRRVTTYRWSAAAAPRLPAGPRHRSPWRRPSTGRCRRAGGRRRVLVFGEDVGTLGGVFRVTDGLTRQLRRRPLLRHPAGRGRHRRHGDRHGDERAAARSSRCSSTRSPTRRSSRSSAMSPRCATAPGARVRAADRDPGAVRRRHRRGRAPLRLLRGLLHAHPRPARRHARPRRPTPTGCCARRSPSDDPVIFLEPKRLYWSKGRRSLSTAHGPADRTGPSSGAPGRDATLIAYGGIGARPRWRPPTPRPRRAGTSRSSTCARLSPFDDETVVRLGARDRPRGRRRTRPPVSAATARRSPRGSPSAASTTWRRRSCASPGSTSPTRRRSSSSTTCPSVDRILDAVDRLQWEDEPEEPSDA